MKLKNGFITRDTKKEQIMVASGDATFPGLVRANSTAAFIINALKEETSVEEIVSAMGEKYDAPANVIRADVENVLQKLRLIGAIDE